jgi:hypothetical protein
MKRPGRATAREQADMSIFLEDLRERWDTAKQNLTGWYAIDAAASEAVDSQLPGRENGPADAYRHLLWGAELTRRFGEVTARTILELHEIQGSASTLIGLDGQTPEAAAMDRGNNEPAIAIGKRARTWQQVVQGVRAFLEDSDRSGNAANGGAVWLPGSTWTNHPKDDLTNEELPPERWSWPEIDWINGRVEPRNPYRYPYGGEEYRYDPFLDGASPTMALPSPPSEVDPLSRPVVTWSEKDLQSLMNSPAFVQPGHPGRARAQAMVPGSSWSRRLRRPRWMRPAGRSGPACASAL